MSWEDSLLGVGRSVDCFARRACGQKCQPLLPAEQQHLRERQRVRVRDRQERRPRSHGGESPRRAAMKVQLRRPAAADDFDVAPEHVLRVAGAEGFHRRFFGCESPGKVNRRFAPAQAVRDFVVGEHALAETIAVTVERGGNARDVGRVEADADNGQHSTA